MLWLRSPRFLVSKECSIRYRAVQPPSTEIAVPVIWSAADEHREATVPLSCAGNRQPAEIVALGGDLRGQQHHHYLRTESTLVRVDFSTAA
jgi:hypothetical protein